MKKVIIFLSIIFLIGTSLQAQINSAEDAKGFFLTVGVGPRFPIGDLGNQQTIGAGFDVMLSYTDIEFAPTFFYLNVGYQNHPGDYDFFKVTDHSSISTNIVSFHAGIKMFFPPLIEDMILLMPVLEGGATYGYVEKYHQYKIDANRNDNLESLSKFGFHIGGGLSFFLMDIVATYNYLHSNQYISFNLRLTIPLAITL